MDIITTDHYGDAPLEWGRNRNRITLGHDVLKLSLSSTYALDNHLSNEPGIIGERPASNKAWLRFQRKTKSPPSTPPQQEKVDKEEEEEGGAAKGR